VLLDKVWGLLANYLQYGFADNGRFAIWRTGVEKFLSAPLFGSGFYDSYVEEEWSFVLYPYLYHNTLIQMLASCGIVGVLAYVWHRMTTVRLVLQKPNAGKSFLGLCIAALLLFSLLDTILFNTYPMIFYALMLLFMEKSVRE
jgi:O-antigen ligase